MHDRHLDREEQEYEAIRRRFSGATGDGNVAAATAAFDGVRPDRAYAHA